MAYFNARLSIKSSEKIDDFHWKIVSNVIDKSIQFDASHVSEGNVIYVDNALQHNIQRFIISEIISVSGMTLEANIKWEKQGEIPSEPLIDHLAIIGEVSENNNLTALTSADINLLPNQFLNSIKNYENFNNIDKLAKLDSPNFSGKTTVETPEVDSNDKQVVNSEWVNKKLGNITSVKKFLAGEKILKNSFVYLSGDNKVLTASNANIQSSDCIIGITSEECEEDQLIEILMDGEVEDINWNFGKSGETLFIGSNGEMIIKPDENSSYIQRVAISTDVDKIKINIGEAILL